MSALQKKLLVALSLLLVCQSGVNLARYLQEMGAGDRFGGDFICFWTAAVRARLGDFQSVYQADVWRQALADHTRASLAWFVYPPFSLFPLQLIGGLSYDQAAAWWSVAPLPVYFALVVAHARRSAARLEDLRPNSGRALGWSGYATLAGLATPFLSANLFCGQTGAFLAVLFLAATYFLPSRPVLAGVFVGLIAVKPQLGLLFPFALAAAGGWRTVAAAAVTVAALVAASVLWLGAAVWADYFAMARLFGQFIARDYGRLEQLAFAPYVSLRSVGVPASLAATAQAAASLAALASIVTVFRRTRDRASARDEDGRLDLRLGLLATGALLSTPYALSYESPLLVLAVIPIFTRAWRRGWDAWELAAVAALVVAPYAQILLVGQRIPFGLAALILTFGALGRRYRLEARGRAAPAGATEPLQACSA